MTLREQCEQVLVQLIDPDALYDLDYFIDIVEAFAKSQQAVGLREAAAEYNKGRWEEEEYYSFKEWCEQRAREREGSIT